MALGLMLLTAALMDVVSLAVGVFVAVLVAYVMAPAVLAATLIVMASLASILLAAYSLEETHRVASLRDSQLVVVFPEEVCSAKFFELVSVAVCLLGKTCLVVLLYESLSVADLLGTACFPGLSGGMLIAVLDVRLLCRVSLLVTLLEQEVEATWGRKLPSIPCHSLPNAYQEVN